MQNAKKYFNQKNVISEIHRRTGFPVSDITQVFYSLEDFVREELGDKNSHVEIRLFSGLKISSQYLPRECSKSNLNISGSGYILRLNAQFSDHFRKELRNPDT